MLRKYASLFILILVAFLLVPFAALAQEGTTVNAGGFFEVFRPYIIELASVLVAFVVAWLSGKISKLTGMQIEAKHREALQSALMNGANYGINRVGGYLSAEDIDLKNQALAAAVTYVQQSVPEALSHFGLTSDRVREMVQAKLPLPLYPDAVGELQSVDAKATPFTG